MDAGAGKRPRAAPEAPDPRLSLLFRVTELLSVEQLPLEGLLDAVAALACEEVAELCGIALLSDSGHLLHPIGLRHRNEQINEQLDSWPRLAWGTAGGASEDALKHNRAFLVPDVDWARAARGREAALEWFKRLDLGSAVVAPMRAGGIQIGVAVVARSRSAVAYETGDVPYIQALADHVGLAVAMARMCEELRQLGATTEAELDLLERLSERERQILQLIAQGFTNREMAERLFLSVRTIEWHRSRLATKLGVSSRAELVAMAERLLP